MEKPPGHRAGRAWVRPRGFTLIELVMIIVALGILSAVAIPRMADILATSRVTATREEMQRLRQALVGNPSLFSGGAASDRGYLGDVGSLPATLDGLVTRPAGVAAWDPYLKMGWHGPYVDSTGGGWLKDAWGAGYGYDPVARTLTSTGSGSNITLRF